MTVNNNLCNTYYPQMWGNEIPGETEVMSEDDENLSNHQQNVILPNPWTEILPQDIWVHNILAKLDIDTVQAVGNTCKNLQAAALKLLQKNATTFTSSEDLLKNIKYKIFPKTLLKKTQWSLECLFPFNPGYSLKVICKPTSKEICTRIVEKKFVRLIGKQGEDLSSDLVVYKAIDEIKDHRVFVESKLPGLILMNYHKNAYLDFVSLKEPKISGYRKLKENFEKDFKDANNPQENEIAACEKIKMLLSGPLKNFDYAVSSNHTLSKDEILALMPKNKTSDQQFITSGLLQIMPLPPSNAPI